MGVVCKKFLCCAGEGAIPPLPGPGGRMKEGWSPPTSSVQRPGTIAQTTTSSGQSREPFRTCQPVQNPTTMGCGRGARADGAAPRTDG